MYVTYPKLIILFMASFIVIPILIGLLRSVGTYAISNVPIGVSDRRVYNLYETIFYISVIVSALLIYVFIKTDLFTEAVLNTNRTNSTYILTKLHFFRLGVLHYLLSLLAMCLLMSINSYIKQHHKEISVVLTLNFFVVISIFLSVELPSGVFYL